MTTIFFKKKTLRFNLFIGCFWIVLGVLAVLNDENLFNYGYLIIGLLYILFYLFYKNYQYLSISKSSITKFGIPKRTLLFTEVNRVKEFADEYILISDYKKMTINKHLIDPISEKDIEHIIEKLKLK